MTRNSKLDLDTYESMLILAIVDHLAFKIDLEEEIDDLQMHNLSELYRLMPTD